MIALFVALGGPATAARLIDGGSIRSNTVTSQQIKNRSLQTADLSRQAYMTLRQTPNRSITTGKLALGAVEASRLADGAVLPAKIAQGAVGPTQLAVGAVTSTKIADSAVGSGAIANGSLTAADVGQFVGAISLDLPTLSPGDCAGSEPFAPKAAGPGLPNPTDDVFVATAAAGLADQLVVSVRQVAGGLIKIMVCHVGNSGDPISTPPRQVFRYLSFDTP